MKSACASPRVEALDTLRFLAASVVMIAHFRAVGSLSQNSASIFSGLLDARAAVSLFFVLSGLVLHLSWAGAWPKFGDAGRFYIRRWFRIYPLYYTALILALIVTTTLPLRDCPLLQSWDASAHVIAADHGDAWQWLHHLLLIPPGLDATFIVPPIWTLAEEMRVSLVFPWLSWCVARASRMASLAMIMIVFTVAPWLHDWICPAAGLLPLFAIGAWVAQHHRSLPAIKAARVWWLALAGLVVYCAAGQLHWRLHQPAVGIGSALMMLALMPESGLRRALSHPLLVLGGRCSFGIYVLHFPILMMTAWWVSANAMLASALYVLGISLSIAAALVLHFTVEMPMIRMGRRLTAR